jgi:hypothetical protein
VDGLSDSSDICIYQMMVFVDIPDSIVQILLLNVLLDVLKIVVGSAYIIRDH